MKKVFEKGFTLVEMLVVLFIIGVILGIGIPIVSNIMNDSSTEEFVTNAKLVEDSVSMYYRDYGVMPISESGDVASKITDTSKEIIKSKLVEAGVINAGDVTEQLVNGGYVKFVKFEDIKEYTSLTKGASGIDVFVVIDMVDDLSNFGNYENDIAGFIFSTENRDKSSGVVYSGAYSIEKEKLEKDKDGKTVIDKEAEEVDKVTEGNKDKDMYPYGFRTKSSEDLKNGKVNLTVTWTDKFVDTNNDLNLFKGFTGNKYTISYVVCDINSSDEACLNILNKEDSSEVTTINIDNDKKSGSTYTYDFKDIKFGKIMMKLKAKEVLYSGNVVSGKESKDALLNSPSDTNDSTEIPVKEPGGGISEILDPNPKAEDFYKTYISYDKNKVDVTSEFNGLRIKNIAIGDYIVLKEIKQVGTSYEFDKNRFYVFKVTDSNVLIPKNPYLQKDFQINPSSSYKYVLEFYKDKYLETKVPTDYVPASSVIVEYK